jgi:hypothetical protein
MVVFMIELIGAIFTLSALVCVFFVLMCRGGSQRPDPLPPVKTQLEREAEWRVR